MSTMRKKKVSTTVPEEPINIQEADEDLLESPTPAPNVIAAGSESITADNTVETINAGRVCFMLFGKPHSLRFPKGYEQLISQQIYSKEFFRLVREGVPSMSQIDINDFLPEHLLEDYNRKVALIEKGYYDLELLDKEDFELPDPEPINQTQIAAAKLRLTLDTLTVTPGTIMLLQNTAETLAQQKQNFYLTWVGLEREENGEWVRAYNTFEEFMELPDNIIMMLLQKRTELVPENLDFLLR